MKELILSLNFLFLFLTLSALLFSYLYLKGVHKTHLDFGIRLPEKIKNLLMANVLLSLAGLLVISIFLIKG